MTFHPNMRSTIEGITVIGELQCRAWACAIADFWRVACTPEARGEYISEAPRLVIIMDKHGEGDIELGLPSQPGDHATRTGDNRGTTVGNLHFIPAQVPICSRARDLQGLCHLDIHFNVKGLAERGLCPANSAALSAPRLNFSDQRVCLLAKLIAAECTGASSSGALYCDSLIAAVAGVLLEHEPSAARKSGPLTPKQLRRVTDFIEQNCHRNIRLQELAEVAGLSESYFSTAFKASTGIPPHRWQTNARIDRAKAILESRTLALAEVAVMTGFSDQAHLTRVFRQVVGTTPGAWVRERSA